MGVKRLAMVAIGILALLYFHPASAVIFGWQQEAVDIELSEDEPVVIAITPFDISSEIKKLSSKQRNTLQLRAWGMTLGLSRILSDTRTVSLHDYEHMRPGSKSVAIGGKNAKRIDLVLTGNIRPAEFGYTLSFKLQSGHTGGILGSGEVWFPKAGNQISGLNELSRQVLSPLAHVPAFPAKDTRWSGWLLENLAFLWSVGPKTAKKIPSGSYDNALVRLMESEPDYSKDWLQHSLLANHVGAVSSVLKSPVPLLLLAQGRKVDAKNRAEALLSKLKSKRIKRNILCMLTHILREMGLLDQSAEHLKSLKDVAPKSPCYVLEEAMALAGRGTDAKTKAAARLEQQIQSGAYTIPMLNALKELAPDKMPKKRYLQLQAERRYSLGSPQSFMELRAARFLEKPDKRLLSVLEMDALTSETRKAVFTRLSELELTGDMKVPAKIKALLEREEPPVYGPSASQFAQDLEQSVNHLLSYIPDNAGKVMLLTNASCSDCKRFSVNQLQSAGNWLTPMVQSTLEKRFRVQLAEESLIRKIINDPGTAESTISATVFDPSPETFVFVAAETDSFFITNNGSTPVPLRMYLSVFQPGTGLRFSVISKATVPHGKVTTTNFLLVIILIVVVTILLVVLLIVRAILKIRRDPRRHAAMLVRNGQIMEATNMLRDAGYVPESEKVMGEHLEAQGKLDAAIGHYLHAGMPQKVLDLYPNIVKKTTEVFTYAAEASIALNRYAKARDYYRFAGNDLGVAKTFELEGNIEAAARMRAEYYEKTENYPAAVEEFVSIEDFEAAGNLCFSLQDYRSAAVLYAQGSKLSMVEKCFLRMGKRLDISKLKRIDIHNLFGGKGDLEL